MTRRMILDMNEAELDAAQPDDFASAIVARLEYTHSLLWSELDEVNCRIPGFAEGAKGIVAEALERIATAIRTSSMPHWKQAAD
jgi:hypothetical protein